MKKIGKRSRSVDIADLAAKGPVEIGIDTEFFETQTLTIQTACIQDNTLRVKVYRAESIPRRPPDFELSEYLPREEYAGFFRRSIFWRGGLISPDLSPAVWIRDLFDISQLKACSRNEAEQRLGQPDEAAGPANGQWDEAKQRWKVPTIRVVLVGHFLPADFGRVFGREFLAEIIESGELVIRNSKRLGFADPRQPYNSAPVVQYATMPGGSMFAIALEMRDTCLPYGPASLDDHSKTFLGGVGKLNSISEYEKADMPQTFRKKTSDAYGYAIRDAVNTLLIHQEMKARDHKMYSSFGVREEDIPQMRPTLGSRAADFLVRMTKRYLDTKSTNLHSARDLRLLMKQGSGDLFQHGHLTSAFGAQTAKVHGGLNFSRSPTTFFHAAEGMLRDVDMRGCYNNALVPLNAYWGRPVILEPGSRNQSLKSAVDLVCQHADSDGWFIRVSGSIQSAPNALIPSTDNALTSTNYRDKRRERILSRSLNDVDRDVIEGPGGGRLYSQQIDSGVITADTWLLIQALPPNQRAEYESLRVDSIVFYPRVLAAGSPEEYDDLVDRYKTDALPWETTLDMKSMKLRRTVKLDADYVTLRFPIGRLAKKIGQMRKQAQRKSGKASGEDLTWKLLANTMYGVLASPYYDTSNIVAANLVTAKARAEAFALTMSLNAIQVITDGCTYRVDQIPACTFQECLEIQPDYPIRRAESNSGVPFLDPASVPADEEEFTEWYRRHVKWFFGVTDPAYDKLFGTHELEHKRTNESGAIAFDGLACDGSSNYIKCTKSQNGTWRLEEFKARSYGRENKKYLAPWIIKTYSSDQLTELPPVTERRDLLTFEEAVQRALAALNAGSTEVFLPLGMEYRRVANYKVIKPSTFLFKTPKQRKTVLRQIQKFEDRVGAGLEILTLRRSYGGRRQGSLRDLADELYQFLQSGSHDLTKKFNLNRTFAGLDELTATRQEELQRRRESAKATLHGQIDCRDTESSTPPTGFFVSEDNVSWFQNA